MTATAERTRLETLREQEVKLAEQVEQLREKISTYPERIAKERESAWYAKPSKRPLAQFNSPLQKWLDDEKKDVATLNGLQQDLSAVRNVIQQEDVRVREQETEEARKKLGDLHTREEAVWQRAGERFGELAAAWNEYVALAEESSRFAYENGLDPTAALAVVPAPTSFRSWLLLLHTASTDAEVRAPDHVQELTETGNYNGTYQTMPAGTKTTVVRRRLDHGDRLHSLIPDLRSVVHKLQLSGRVPTIASE
jgi:DNA repair exonuclease SbcCD ATPase subunit